MKKLPLTLSALAFALGLAAAGGAQATLLSALLNGGSIQAGDKLFDQWQEFTTGRSVINTANIDVTALNDGGMNPGPGLSFSVLNNELSVTGDGIYAYLDYMFGFHVSVLAPNLQIKDNSLTLTGYNLGLQPVDLTSVYIQEKVYANQAMTQLVGTTDVQADSLGTTKLSDAASFTPLSDIWVTKNILLEAIDPADTATLSSFEQRFSQVPEPGTLLLFVPAMAALVGVRRRKTTTA